MAHGPLPDYCFIVALLLPQGDSGWIPWYCGIKGNEFFAEVEEETLIFPGAFLLTGMAPLATGGHNSVNYDAWYRRQDNKRGAYRYLKAFLQVLSSEYGPGTPEEQSSRNDTPKNGDDMLKDVSVSD